MPITLLVRHSPSRAVLARVEDAPCGVRLLEVIQKDGPMPEVSHLIGGCFPDNQALRRALVAAMKSTVGDTLDNVQLSASAYYRWMEVATRAAREALEKGQRFDSKSIPDEMAKPLPDGGLLIWVDAPWGRVEMTVPRGEWAWIKRPN